MVRIYQHAKFQAISQLVSHKIPENPQFDQFHEVKIAPKLEKSTDRNHNLISSVGGQDTAAYHSSSSSNLISNRIQAMKDRINV